MDRLWHVLLDLAEALPGAWTLIGGQMVLLHAIEHGVTPSQVSEDGDVVADVRTVHQVLPRLSAALTAAAFEPDISADGLAHRFVRPAEPKPIKVDVLAPEGLRPDAPLFTVPPGRTITTPGGTQALHRTEQVMIDHEGRIGPVPRPTLLGAVVMKAAACGLGGDISRHLRDLALLLSIVGDPFAMTEEMTAKDRRRLQRVEALQDGTHAAWALLQPTPRGVGQSTLEILTAKPE